MKFLIWFFSLFVKKEVMPPVEPEPEKEVVVTPSTRDTLYTVAKSLLGKHLTLNPLVDQRLGCAQALSYVLKQVKWTSIPKHGIDGTAGLLQWFNGHIDLFKEVSEPQIGTIILNVTGTGNGKVRGHVGIVGKNSIMSNNSQSGLWDTHWDLETWKAYYEKFGGMKTHYFDIV